MTLKEFRNRVHSKFEGYTIEFDHNEAEFAAFVLHPSGVGEALCKSNSYSENIHIYINGKLEGSF